MKVSIIRVLVFLVSLCIVINVGYQIYLNVSSPYETEVVYSETIDEKLDAQGLMFKDETVISCNQTGVVQYVYKNGEKVALQANVAMVYQSESDVAATEQMEILDDEIARLNESQGKGIAQESDLSVLNQELSSDYYELVQNIQHNQLGNLSEQKMDLTTVFNKRQIVTGKVQNFDASIANLSDQKAQLQASITSQPQSVITPSSGYFVDSTDGLEGTLNLDYADSITTAELQNLVDQQSALEDSGQTAPVAGSIGKVISKPKLELVALVPSNQVASLGSGRKCDVQFSKFDAAVDATLEVVKYDSTQDKSIVILSMDMMNEELASLRYDNAEIILNSYTGLRVPKEAVRTNENGEMGVYASNSASMAFKKIDPLYETEDYVLSKPHSDDTSYLRLYDSVIVKGKDLYDNKPIR